jgi:hypothetical protein
MLFLTLSLTSPCKAFSQEQNTTPSQMPDISELQKKAEGGDAAAAP